MSNREVWIKGKFRYRPTGLKHSASARFVCFALLAVLFYFSLSGSLLKQTYDLHIGSVTEKDIPAPEQIENVQATQKAKETAVQNVRPVYTLVSVRNEELVDAVFDKIDQLNADDQVTFDDKVNIYRNVFTTMFNDFVDRWTLLSRSQGLYGNAFFDEANRKMSEQSYRIPEETFFKIPRLAKEDIPGMKTVTKEIVGRLMTDQIVDAQTARAKVPELVNASSLAKKTNREIVQEIARYALAPNKFFDRDATERTKTEAREQTPPVYFQKGEVLVPKGQTITEDVYQKLKTLQLLKDRVNYRPQAGLALLSVILTFILFMFVRDSRLPIRTNNAQLLMLTLIVALNVLALKIVSLVQAANEPLAYLAPVAMGAMLIVILLDVRLALASSVLFAIVSSIVFNPHHGQIFDFRYGFIAVTVCFGAVFIIQKASQRSSILRAGILVSLIGSVSMTALMFLNETLLSHTLLVSLAYSMGSGLLTAILVIGLLPFFEATFGILSPLKLVELSNPNHPLLRKLLTETPGTYHHSIMVGNLAEAAAEAIGANGLLCRVGSHYHDIGKTKRPGYFIENQMNGDNPHDQISPELSKSIIIAHAKDGVDMLKDYNLPKAICDIAEQHHGTTLLKYFYHKARKLQEEQGQEPTVTEEMYRYPGPKAQTKETAVVGIADCVEAAVRSMRNPTPEQVDSMLGKIIKNRLDDGQFNECDLTLKELDLIGRTMKETLLGIFHSRIEYPEDTAPKKQAESGQGGIGA